MLGKGDWLARKVRDVLPEVWAPGQMLIMTAWGCQRPCHPMEGSGGALVGEVRETGKVTWSDRLEKYTCFPKGPPSLQTRAVWEELWLSP